MKYICTLEGDVPCENRLSDNTHCNGNTCCGFCTEEKETPETMPKGYVRKERWYEKYYR